jgi:ABC-type Fe3+-hydroxamate transport system substrate-binding protein
MVNGQWSIRTRDNDQAYMQIKIKDQAGGVVVLDKTPKRIISLVPSQTELLADLGLDEAVVGITKFCVHPEEWFRSKTRVGGTKTVDIEKIKALRPDLIIANKEENVKEQVDELRDIAPVYVSDVNDLDGALSMIKDIGDLTGNAMQAEDIITSIRTSFEHLQAQLPNNNDQLSTAYLIWRDPYMVAGGDTFIGDMMRRCGLTNAFEHWERYPEVGVEELAQCDLILLSSEPYPFQEKHIDEFCTKYQISRTKLLLVDGEMFSWYGSRLRRAAGYFGELINKK